MGGNTGGGDGCRGAHGVDRWNGGGQGSRIECHRRGVAPHGRGRGVVWRPCFDGRGRGRSRRVAQDTGAVGLVLPHDAHRPGQFRRVSHPWFATVCSLRERGPHRGVSCWPQPHAAVATREGNAVGPTRPTRADACRRWRIPACGDSATACVDGLDCARGGRGGRRLASPHRAKQLHGIVSGRPSYCGCAPRLGCGFRWQHANAGARSSRFRSGIPPGAGTSPPQRIHDTSP